MQLHVDLNSEFYLRFKVALKKNGEYRTISEFVRAKMREIIKTQTETTSNFTTKR